MNIFELIHKYEKIANQDAIQDEKNICIDDFAGGNVDDAFYQGQRDGEIFSARDFTFELEKLVEDEAIAINFDYCPCCHADQKKRDNSLHCWSIEYECGCIVSGKLENNQFIFENNCLDKN